MTKEQKEFMLGKMLLDKLAKIEETRPLTAKEASNKDEILRSLFETVARFGISKARKRLSKYMKSEDAFQDIQQDLAVIFYEKLPYYDPTRSTPTTYFLRYFDQVITKYILSYSQHLTQYDANNIALVRAATKYYESRGIKWDESMLTTITGLSAKVVRNTLQLASNSVQANIDDMIGTASNLPTPEEVYIDNERTTTLIRVLTDVLSTEDLQFLLYKVNPGGKERSYQQVATALGLQVRDVKKRYSNIIARLNSNSDLQVYRRSGSKGSEPKVHLTAGTKDDGTHLMFEALSNTPLHNDDEFGPDAGKRS